MSSYKAAAVIASPYLFDLKRTVAKSCDLIDEAAANGAKLIAFPETFLPNYPWWIWLAVDNVKKGQLFKRLYDESVDLEDPVFQQICHKAKEHGVFVVIGINERAHGTLYNSQVFIDETGQIVQCRRKLIPTGEERTVWGRGDGSDLTVLDTSLGRIGALICYENIMPQARYTLYSMHEQVHIANWPGNEMKSQPRDRTEIIKLTSRFAALEGQMYVIASSSYFSEEEVSFYRDLDPNLGATLTPGGGVAAIYSPFGQVLAEIVGEEGIVYADIDLEKIVDAKHILDTVGHYARPDVHQVLFDGSSKRPVIRSGVNTMIETSSYSTEETQPEELAKDA